MKGKVGSSQGIRPNGGFGANKVPALLFIVLSLAGVVATAVVWRNQDVQATFGFLGSLVVAGFISSAVKVIPHWERAVVLRLGRFSGIREDGVTMIIPILEQLRRVDTRIITLDIPAQQVITKDNVPVLINGVLFFKVTNVADAVLKVQDFQFAISQYAQTALRDVVGGMTLDELLSEREKIGSMIEKSVESESQQWGLEVTSIKLQDIDMPEDLKRMMSRQASAEREKRANITKAEGDKIAAINLAEAAETMRTSPGAMQLRTLQTIDGLGPTASNTVVLGLPVDVMEAVRMYADAKKKS